MWPAWLYTLGDARDRWFGEDKVAHLFGAGWVTALFGWWVGLGAIVGIEVLEAWRWSRLSINARIAVENGTHAWPVLTDRASLKDVLAGLLGVGLTLWLQ